MKRIASTVVCPITSAYKFILKFRFCKLIIIHKREKEYNRKFYPSSKEYENRVIANYLVRFFQKKILRLMDHLILINAFQRYIWQVIILKPLESCWILTYMILKSLEVFRFIFNCIAHFEACPYHIWVSRDVKVHVNIRELLLVILIINHERNCPARDHWAHFYV